LQNVNTNSTSNNGNIEENKLENKLENNDQSTNNFNNNNFNEHPILSEQYDMPPNDQAVYSLPNESSDEKSETKKDFINEKKQIKSE
jgi:hypothetical protein